jgi:superfamily II DNA or RNA helicase
VVPRKTLIDQTVREFECEGITAIGVMQAAHLRTDGRQPVQICSAQTLARRRRPEVDLVIVDEAHELHKSVLTWIAECPDVPFIGLSAIPWQRGLGKHYDDLLIPTTTRELIDAGYLSDFVAYAPSDPDLLGVSTKRGDYDQDELAGVMDTVEITADIVKTWLERPRLLVPFRAVGPQAFEALIGARLTSPRSEAIFAFGAYGARGAIATDLQ